MIKTVIAAAAALTLLAGPASADDHEMTRGEAKLAEMLDGRVAGSPENCIRTTRNRNLTQIDDTALVYREGKTVWVNYTRNPQSIDNADIMVIERFDGSNLCRSDQVKMIDRYNGFLSGVLFLDEFVPYRMADTGPEG